MQEKNYVGIDIGKRIMEITRIRFDEKLERYQFKTDSIGRKKLYSILKKNDIVGIEAGCLSFLIAKEMKIIGIEVIVLNPGDLANIYNSLKKTDKEDSLKIARVIKRNPRKELPEVRLPDEYEEKARSLISEQEYWVTSKTRATNRLHSQITMTGLTTVSKKEIKDKKIREAIINGLESYARECCLRILKEVNLAEEQLKILEEKIIVFLKEKVEKVKIIMSITGIGKLTTLTILGYIGDVTRFSNERQVSYYAGLVPRVDCSGETHKYGRIVKGCRQLKRVMIQCAWALVRSPEESEIKSKYEELRKRKGSGRAIVMVARKMIELVYILLSRNEYYRYMPAYKLNKKLALSKII